MKRNPTSTPDWLVVMPLLSSSLLIVTVLLSILLNSSGVSVGSLPATTPEELFASVAYAPVAEEVGFRITPIGLLIVIRTLLPLHRGRGRYSEPFAALSFLTTIFLSIAGLVYGIRWLKPVKTPIMQTATPLAPPPQF